MCKLQFISFILGMIICSFADLLFKLILYLSINRKLNLHQPNEITNKIKNINKSKQIIKFLYLAELVKLTFFSLSVLFTFKYLTLLLDAKIFIISILVYLIFNLAKNLLKLML